MRQLAGPQRGFTLIEVLVTMIVASIGLLTVAGLQAASKRMAYEATQRTTAAALAVDLVERMRANPADLLSGASGYLTSNATTATASVDCSAATCTPAQLAAYDVAVWGQKLTGAEETMDEGATPTGGLVSPTGCVTLQNGTYLVAVAWRGSMPLPAPEDAESNDPSVNPCGASSGLYDDPASTTTDTTLRRIIVVPVHVTNPAAAWK